MTEPESTYSEPTVEELASNQRIVAADLAAQHPAADVYGGDSGPPLNECDRLRRQESDTRIEAIKLGKRSPSDLTALDRARLQWRSFHEMQAKSIEMQNEAASRNVREVDYEGAREAAFEIDRRREREDEADDQEVIAEQQKIMSVHKAADNFDGLLGPATDVTYSEPKELARLKFSEPVIDPRTVDRSKKGFQSVRMVTELFFELPARTKDRLGNLPPPPSTLQVGDHIFGWSGADPDLENVLPKVQRYVELDAPHVIPRDQDPVDSPVLPPF